jgi:hypothetical protein
MPFTSKDTEKISILVFPDVLIIVLALKIEESYSNLIKLHNC